MASAVHANTALLAIDWGTSSLRGARLDGRGQVLEERTFPRGILHVPAGSYGTVFDECFGDWARAAATCNAGPGGAHGSTACAGNRTVRCLISGMAGSKQGWVQAPYCVCPAGLDDMAAQLRWIDDPALPLPTAIVPGLRCAPGGGTQGVRSVPDVMRGEEVQILGAMLLGGWRDGLCILPGTHSKRAWVVDGQVASFRSYMTGEFYALLTQHSLLARTVDAQAPFDPAAFALGLTRAREGGSLLHHAFGARTLSLFGHMQAGPLASYLSGLVIGEELRDLDSAGVAGVTLVGSPALATRYALACDAIGIASHCLGSEATWAGLHVLSRHLVPHAD